jgi:hypothetical protein
VARVHPVVASRTDASTEGLALHMRELYSHRARKAASPTTCDEPLAGVRVG